MYLFTKTPSGLAPFNDNAREFLARKKQGALIRGDFVEPRNPDRLAKFWVIIDTLFEALPDRSVWATRDDMREDIEIALGFCDQIKGGFGRTWTKPRSISFAKMKEAEFVAFLEAVRKLVREKALHRVTDEELRARLEEMVG